MISIREIFATFGPEYLQRYATAMPKAHRKVIDAITACRTEACGMAFYQCDSCAEPSQFFRSCGNRHCPTCQYDKTQQWLRKQIERQLPGHHFLITFSVPEQLPSFMRQHQRACYSALFKASSDAIQKLALDPKHIGGNLPGFFGVLHTWGRTLQYHPHIHYVVSGGALRSSDGSWHPSRVDFFLPVKALSKIFRAKFRELIEQAKLLDRIPPDLWQIAWNVNCQALASSQATFKYLAPYVFKVAISNSPILAVQDRTVLIHYRKPHSQRSRILALDVMEFIRRFLQHVLPTGFIKIRSYGFINPNCAVPLERIRGLIELSYGFAVDLPLPEVEPPRLSTCPTCGGLLKFRSGLPPIKILRRSG
jgi:Putative transposase/Transposase zinc-binding domain